MKKFFTALMQTAVIATLLGSISNTATAQVFQRFELSGGLTMGAGSVNSTTRYYDVAHPGIISGESKNQTFNYRTIYASANMYFPLAYLRRNRMLALNIGGYYNGNKIEISNPGLSPGTTADALNNIIIGLPIGVDYIYGGEASLNKGDRISLRAGAGIMPFMDMTQFDSKYATASTMSVRPYLKAELGIFAGIEWKIKTQVLLGSRTIYEAQIGDYSLQDTPTYTSFDCKLQTSYSVGLAIMPFSMGWRN